MGAPPTPPASRPPPDATPPTTAEDGPGRGGTPAAGISRGGRGAGGASRASSRGCHGKYFAGTHAPGKLLASGRDGPAAKRWLGAAPPGQGRGFYRAPDPASHVKPGSARGQKLQAKGLFLGISQPLASLMNPGHSAFELQHFLEPAAGK